LPMKKGICERCGEYKWVNLHHIYPKEHFGTKGNTELVRLCLDCHADIHDLLPKEKKEKTFYKDFIVKFLSGSLTIVLIGCITKLIGLW
jgi:hypothetical protein